MTAPATPRAADVYAAALAAGSDGGQARLAVRGRRGTWSTVDIRPWLDPPTTADHTLVDRCTGPTLDAGCGPGRLTAAVAATGTPALGVDISPAAVQLARQRGVSALCRSVFRRLPGEGRWRHVLLADGNIGIGGDPGRLLARCRNLLDRTGTILVELRGPGRASRRETLRLRHGTVESGPFRWAYLSVDDLPAAAHRTGLRVREIWTEAGRWFAVLALD